MNSLRLLFLAPVAAVIAAAQVAPPATAVFDKPTVHEIRITFKEADWYEILTKTYDQYPDNTPYLEGSVSWGEYKFDGVGIRFKGNSSYRGATTRKKPFRIKLNEFTKGQKIDGMASFGLSNLWNDPSFVRENAYFELAAKSGLAAPRSNFAALYVNNEYMGLYVLGEIVNGDFLKNHFAKGDDTGNLYKASDPGANLAYLGEDPAPYQAFFSKESNEDANDWTDLIELARIFEQTSPADLPARIEKLVDVDSFLTALALDNATVNLDSYVGMAQNYFLYRRPSDHKWVWIPWDPSLAFGALGQNLSAQQMRDLSLEWTQSTAAIGGGGGGGAFPGGPGIPGGGGGAATATRNIATKLWAVPQYKARYREIYQAIADQVMIPAEVIDRMNQLRDLIRPYVEKDTQKLVTQAQFDNAIVTDAIVENTPATGNPGIPGGGAQFGGGLGGAPTVQPFLEARSISVKAQLAGQTPPLFSAVPLSLISARVAANSTPVTQTVALSLPSGTGTYAARSSAPWITIANAQGVLPTSLQVTTNAAGMNPGTYTGAIGLTVSGTTNSPLSIPVTMIVTSAPAIATNPTLLNLNGFNRVMAPGGPQTTAAITQTLTVVSTAGASPFTAAIGDASCANVFSLSTTSGTTPSTLTLTANSEGVTAACTARINIVSAGLASASVPVTLNPVTFPTGPGGPGFPTGPFPPGN